MYKMPQRCLISLNVIWASLAWPEPTEPELVGVIALHRSRSQTWHNTTMAHHRVTFTQITSWHKVYKGVNPSDFDCCSEGIFADCRGLWVWRHMVMWSECGQTCQARPQKLHQSALLETGVRRAGGDGDTHRRCRQSTLGHHLTSATISWPDQEVTPREHSIQKQKKHHFKSIEAQWAWTVNIFCQLAN